MKNDASLTAEGIRLSEDRTQTKNWKLVKENRRRGLAGAEFELADTGVFSVNRYFDVQVEYAKAAPDDLLIRISATNRGSDAAPCG